jgi:5-methyltetrahydrofolate--homocysteine methyltransferase
VATALVSDTGVEEYVGAIAADYQHVRDVREGKGQSALLSLADARANAFVADMSDKPPPPEQPGLHVFDDWDLADLADVIDWTPFFRAWELAGNFPAILTDEVVGESATALWADAQAMLKRIIDEKWFTARGVAGLWPCRREGDDVIVHVPMHPEQMPAFAGDEWTARAHGVPASLPGDGYALDGDFHHVRLPFLRQQIAKREGRANMCLADFIDHDGDWIGGFAVGIHGLEPHLERFRADKDDYSDILAKALADRFAEAFAERLHQHVRTTLWGYAPGEQLTNEALIREQYRGIRPAPGYPACPEHSLKPILFDLLDAEQGVGLTLTENFAMLPTAAVSGFYFGHPQSEYFGVARVGEEQLQDYAVRRGVDVDTARRWLRPNLD